jgi:hypothetical protein
MIPRQDSASNRLNKLARTFKEQVEASKRYRSGGELTVKVQHATVNHGEQGEPWQWQEGAPCYAG